MSLLRWSLVVPLLALAVAGCAKSPQRDLTEISYRGHDQVDARLVTASIGEAPGVSDLSAKMPSGLLAPLGGRTLAIDSNGDIALRPGEVVLTFDDGPRPGRTTSILDTLDAYGVKATFLMVGQMAAAHPQTAQLVALRGHSIGTHTWDHANLAELARDAAIAEIQKGERAIKKALAPIGASPAPFFRFPYLAQTGFLRTSLAGDRVVVLDVDIDSKDYFSSTPDEVANRTLRMVEKKGRGIILLHDVHARTARMLPKLLDGLRERGFTVVHLVPPFDGPFATPLVTAAATLGKTIEVSAADPAGFLETAQLRF